MDEQLVKIKNMLTRGLVAFSFHAETELHLSGLTEYDAIASVLNASIWSKIEKEKGEIKYIFDSQTFEGIWVYSVGKIKKDEKENDYYYFYITAKRSTTT